MQIDPLEAVVQWLTNTLTIVGGRVAGKHRYGNGWSESQTAVSVHLDGGLPDLYAPVATPRFEIRIYSGDQVNVVDVWRALIQLSRTNERFAVSTSKGNALVHTFLPESNLSLIYDEVLRMEMGIIFFSCMVAEVAVSE